MYQKTAEESYERVVRELGACNHDVFMNSWSEANYLPPAGYCNILKSNWTSKIAILYGQPFMAKMKQSTIDEALSQNAKVTKDAQEWHIYSLCGNIPIDFENYEYVNNVHKTYLTSLAKSSVISRKVDGDDTTKTYTTLSVLEKDLMNGTSKNIERYGQGVFECVRFDKVGSGQECLWALRGKQTLMIDEYDIVPLATYLGYLNVVTAGLTQCYNINNKMFCYYSSAIKQHYDNIQKLIEIQDENDPFKLKELLADIANRLPRFDDIELNFRTLESPMYSLVLYSDTSGKTKLNPDEVFSGLGEDKVITPIAYDTLAHTVVDFLKYQYSDLMDIFSAAVEAGDTFPELNIDLSPVLETKDTYNKKEPWDYVRGKVAPLTLYTLLKQRGILPAAVPKKYERNNTIESDIMNAKGAERKRCVIDYAQNAILEITFKSTKGDILTRECTLNEEFLAERAGDSWRADYWQSPLRLCEYLENNLGFGNNASNVERYLREIDFPRTAEAIISKLDSKRVKSDTFTWFKESFAGIEFDRYITVKLVAGNSWQLAFNSRMSEEEAYAKKNVQVTTTEFKNYIRDIVELLKQVAPAKSATADNTFISLYNTNPTKHSSVGMYADNIMKVKVVKRAENILTNNNNIGNDNLADTNQGADEISVPF
jgi:hypothetical protein